ncbi:MAG: hypothetical protein WD845_06060 [Pirellulales bacterium]
MATDFTREQLAAQSAAVEAAVKLAVRDALLQHKCAGNPICVWRDGKVVWIPADEIQVDEEANDG